MDLRSLPKAELHVHLEGAVDAETLREIDPRLTADEIARAHEYADFGGFIQTFVWVNRKLVEPRHYGLAARRLFANQLAQGVSYTEVTVSAGVVLWKKQDLEAVFQTLMEEAAQTPLEVKWILDATRQWGAEAAAPVFDFAARHIDDGVVAIGLGGIEAEGPASWYRDLYATARDRGLRLVCHAGETTTAQSVWDAIEIGAERIGHGIRAVEDPALMAYLRENDIPLEVNITSNVRTGAVPSFEAHPVRRLFDAGVPLLLGTDDPAIFACNLLGEYELAKSQFGFSDTELAALARNSFEYAFR